MKFNLDDAVRILENTPAALRTLLSGLPDGWISENEGGESWSPFDIVGHLIHGEKTDWIPRAKIILEHGEARTFEPFDRFAQFKESKGKSLQDLLEEFEVLRKQSLAELEGMKLDEGDLRKRGMHPELGPVSLKQLLATWVVHDLGHLNQITRVMAKQLKEDVGPWGVHLPVIGPS